MQRWVECFWIKALMSMLHPFPHLETQRSPLLLTRATTSFANCSSTGRKPPLHVPVDKLFQLSPSFYQIYFQPHRLFSCICFWLVLFLQGGPYWRTKQEREHSFVVGGKWRSFRRGPAPGARQRRRGRSRQPQDYTTNGCVPKGAGFPRVSACCGFLLLLSSDLPLNSPL